MADFSPGERNAYVVWTQKLADRTLPKAEHDLANAELDKLFRRGPFAELHLLKDELAQIKSRLAVLEEFVLGSNPTTLDEPVPVVVRPRPPAPRAVYADASNKLNIKDTALRFPPNGTEPLTMSIAPPAAAGPRPPLPGNPMQRAGDQMEMFFNAALGEEFIVKAEGHVENPPAADAVENAEENRGRKPLRFHPEKGANKQWFVLDRSAGVYTDHGPYKTRREAKDMADTLNKMGGNPPAPAGKNAPPADELPDKWDPAMGDPTDMDAVLEDYQENFDLGF